MIALRRETPALRDGKYVAVNRDDPNVLAYLRKGPNGANSVLVALNMSSEARTITFKLGGFGVEGNSLYTLAASPKQADHLKLEKVELEPFGVIVAEVK